MLYVYVKKWNQAGAPFRSYINLVFHLHLILGMYSLLLLLIKTQTHNRRVLLGRPMCCERLLLNK